MELQFRSAGLRMFQIFAPVTVIGSYFSDGEISFRVRSCVSCWNGRDMLHNLAHAFNTIKSIIQIRCNQTNYLVCNAELMVDG